MAEQHGARYSRLPEGLPGRRAQARCRGHELAQAPVTLYLDGDVIPEPRVLVTALSLHTEMSRIAVKYPVYSISEENHSKSLSELARFVISQNLPRLGPVVRKHVGIDTRPLPRRLRGKKTKLWALCASHCTSFERAQVEDVGGWDQEFLGWGEEDLELAYRLFLAGIHFVYPHRKYGAGYHLDHPVDWSTNVPSLFRNVQRFRSKFPDSWPGRKGLLKQFLDENDLPCPDFLLADGNETGVD